MKKRPDDIGNRQKSGTGCDVEDKRHEEEPAEAEDHLEPPSLSTPVQSNRSVDGGQGDVHWRETMNVPSGTIGRYRL